MGQEIHELENKSEEEKVLTKMSIVNELASLKGALKNVESQMADEIANLKDLSKDELKNKSEEGKVLTKMSILNEVESVKGALENVESRFQDMAKEKKKYEMNPHMPIRLILIGKPG